MLISWEELLHFSLCVSQQISPQMCSTHEEEHIYIYIYIYIYIEHTLYSSTFSMEINRAGSFCVPEDCQHHLLCWLLHLELFLYRRISMFQLHGLSFHRGQPTFNSDENSFLTQICFSIPIRHSSFNFTWFNTKNLMTDLFPSPLICCHFE